MFDGDDVRATQLLYAYGDDVMAVPLLQTHDGDAIQQHDGDARLVAVPPSHSGDVTPWEETHG